MWTVLRGNAADGTTPTTILEFDFVWPDEDAAKVGGPLNLHTNTAPIIRVSQKADTDDVAGLGTVSGSCRQPRAPRTVRRYSQHSLIAIHPHPRRDTDRRGALPPLRPPAPHTAPWSPQHAFFMPISCQQIHPQHPPLSPHPPHPPQHLAARVIQHAWRAHRDPSLRALGVPAAGPRPASATQGPGGGGNGGGPRFVAFSAKKAKGQQLSKMNDPASKLK